MAPSRWEGSGFQTGPQLTFWRPAVRACGAVKEDASGALRCSRDRVWTATSPSFPRALLPDSPPAPAMGAWLAVCADNGGSSTQGVFGGWGAGGWQNMA